jgi:hypothetical protein
MKIQRIEVKNFKAISDESIDFNGCSAIISAGNNKGKSSLLRGIIDRFHGEKPELIVKKEEKQGYYILWLTDGNRIEWKFTENTEMLCFITKDGIKQTSGILKSIGEKYFGLKFDIDKFLLSPPKKQTEYFQKLLGLDFTEIDLRYKVAYDERSLAKKILENLLAQKIQNPEKIEKPDIDKIKEKRNKLNLEYENKIIEIRAGNDNIRREYELSNDNLRSEIDIFNKEQSEIYKKQQTAILCLNQLKAIGFESNELQIFCNSFSPQNLKNFNKLPEPIFESENIDKSELREIENEIEIANSQNVSFSIFEQKEKEYETWINSGKIARINVENAENKVRGIESEKQKMIASAKIPVDFEIKDSEMFYKGFALNNNQQSSSSKYIAALKLGSFVLGDLRTMHFDASFLDKNSLAEIQEWADVNDLQLLIERPDFDGGEIKYEIINN